MKTAIFVLIVIIIATGTFYLQSSNKVCFEEKCIKVEIAETPEEQKQGLMFRQNLDENRGMLFIYPKESRREFWMKNTNIPLDIIWIDSKQQIIKITKANPCLEDPCETYSSSIPAQYVLEVNQGFTDRYGIKIGDRVDL